MWQAHPTRKGKERGQVFYAALVLPAPRQGWKLGNSSIQSSLFSDCQVITAAFMATAAATATLTVAISVDKNSPVDVTLVRWIASIKVNAVNHTEPTERTVDSLGTAIFVVVLFIVFAPISAERLLLSTCILLHIASKTSNAYLVKLTLLNNYG